MSLFTKKTELPRPEQALKGARALLPLPERHYVNGHPLSRRSRRGSSR